MASRIVIVALALLMPNWLSAADDALAIFKQRILPIMKSQQPSSCSECHLGGVDLKDYVRDDQAETFAALRDRGLIDTKHPDESKLLRFIERNSGKTPERMRKAREMELAAFREWIRAAVKDTRLVAAKTDDPAIGAKLPEAVIRHMRNDRVLQSFVDNVWSEIGRCAGCHSPDRNQKQVDKFGEQVSWIKLGDPQATLQHLRESELIDINTPEKSLLLMKPTNQVEHGGGVKMMVGDRTYKNYRAFLEDLAASVQARYTSSDQLPARSSEVAVASGMWFKIEGLPRDWDKLLLRADIFPWDEQKNTWSTERVATGDRAVAGDRALWQQHVTMIVPRESPRAKELSENSRLPPGRYLARVYVDREGRLAKNYRDELKPSDLVAEIKFESQWATGYGNMTTVKFPADRPSR